MKGKRGSKHRIIEDVKVAQSPSLAISHSSNRESLLRRGRTRSHLLLHELSKALQPGLDSGTILHVLTVLRTMAKLGMLERDSDEIELVRQLVTYSVLLAVADIGGSASAEDDCIQALRDAAVQLAVSILSRRDLTL